MPPIRCAVCGADLDVAPGAPAQLTCPRCLALIRDLAAAPRADAPIRAIPVAPADRDVRRDLRATMIGLAITAVILLAGVLLLAWRGAAGRRIGMFWFVAVATAAAVALVILLPRLEEGWRDARANRGGEGSDADLRSPSVVLDYGHAPADPSHRDRAWAAVTRVVSFFVGIVAGPIAVVEALGQLGVQAAFWVLGAAVVLCFVPGSRAFAAGALVGIGVAVSIVWSICSGMKF